MSTYHHGDLRRALIEAADTLLDEAGPDGVSMREAARVAGVSRGAPYRHFRNRDELMSALAARGHTQMFRESVAAMNSQSPIGRLRAQGLTSVRFALRRPEMFRVMNTAAWIAPGASPEMDVVLAAHATATRQLADEAADAGELDGDIDASVLACQALVYGLSRIFVDGHAQMLGIDPGDADAVVMAAIDVIGEGLIPR